MLAKLSSVKIIALASFVQSVNNLYLMLRVYSCINCNVLNNFLQLLYFFQLLSCQAFAFNAYCLSNGLCSYLMVARYHNNLNAGFSAFFNCFLNFLSWRINHSLQAKKCKVFFCSLCINNCLECKAQNP